MYIHADLCYTASVPPEHKSVYTYMHSLVLECALEFPNTPLPMIGLIKKMKYFAYPQIYMYIYAEFTIAFRLLPPRVITSRGVWFLTRCHSRQPSVELSMRR